MDDLNNIFFLGNLTKDPELGQTEHGCPYTEISIAVNKNFNNSQGENIQTVDYVSLTCFNTLAHNCACSLKKGSRVLVAGHVKFKSQRDEEKKQNRMFLVVGVVAASLEFDEVMIPGS